MPTVPSPRSFQQILQTMTQVFVAQSGVNDLATGSAIRSFLEAASMSDFRSQGDIISTLNSNNIDRAEGTDLDNIGNSLNVPRPQAAAAYGNVNIGSSNFTKISTVIYAGSAAPPAGSTVISVSDASLFPATGSIYLGRGSNNVEGPIIYNSITVVGNYYQLNLATATVKNHNVNDTVVLAQGGNRVVSVGSLVQTPANTTSPSVVYRLLQNVTIPDGEDILTGIPVVCTQLGSLGNVPANSITSLGSTFFVGAYVTNPSAFVTGQDTMADADYRLLIKNTQQSMSRGTELAIETAAIGVTSTDDNKTVVSAQIQEPANREEPAILYIDDGTGYEPIFSSQGFEQVISSANGGEKYLQLQHEDITKALLVSTVSTPFALTGNMSLNIEVGGVLSTHTFQDSDFATQNAATALEIVNSINANSSLLFSARTADNEQNVVIFAKNFINEDLQVVPPVSGIDANQFIGFDTNLTYSLRLYKNSVLLIKDGVIPTITSEVQSNWSVMTSPETLSIKVDQTPEVTYTFTNSSFVPFGYSSLSQNNSLQSWADVFNANIPGITATVNGSKIELQSNKEANNLAYLSIDPSSSLAQKMFGASSSFIISQGAASDYSLNRSTGQVELVVPLVAGDNVAAGSENTRAFIDSTEISSGTVNLPAAVAGVSAGPVLWLVVDSPCTQVPDTANALTTITITNPSTNVWQFTSNQGTAFSDVEVGDWVVISDNSIYAFNPNFVGYWRVSAVSGNYFQFYMTQSLGSTGGPLVLSGSNDLTFVRTAGDVQQIPLLSGSNTLNAIATGINSNLLGGTASSPGGTVLQINSNSFGSDGKIYLAGQTQAAAALGFAVGETDSSTVSHIAFAESGNGNLTIPDFVWDTVSAGNSSIPPTSFTGTTSLSSLNVDQNQILAFLNPYINYSSNAGIYTNIASYSGTAVNIRAKSEMKDILAGDRYFAASPFNFESQDNLVIIFDNNPVNETLNIRMSRKGLVNNNQTPTSTQFQAYDYDAGPAANYPTQFGNNFSFNDYKVHFQARQVLTPSGSNNKMLLRSNKFGPTGENIRFGIAYPTAPASVISSMVDVRRYSDISVYLASGSQRLGGTWDSTTQIDVTTTATNIWRYTYNGIGTAPLFVSGAGIQVGDIVNILSPSNFSEDNTGQFKITTVTDTYFEVTNFYGVAENNILLIGASNLVFYPLNSGSNTASLIGSYVNANLSQYLTISQLQSGTGTVSTSTFDDQSGSSQYVQLADGENFVLLSNIGTTSLPTNQFNLKLALTISDPDYSIVGETFYLIPILASQIVLFLNVFSVSALSFIGNIVASDAGDKIELYSDLFGQNGAVLVSGGYSNSADGAVTVNGESLFWDNVNTVYWNGTNVTITTLDDHAISVGDTIIVENVNNSQFNGRFTVSSVTAKSLQYSQSITAPIISAISRSSNMVTVTISVPAAFAINDVVTISGVTDSSFDGTFSIASVLSSTQFTYYQAGVNASSSGGTISAFKSFNGQIYEPYTKFDISQSNVGGFQAGQWVKISNTAVQPKNLGFDSTTQLSITNLNTVTINSGDGTFQTERTYAGDSTTQIKVEKQGDFVAFSWNGQGTNPNFVSSGIEESDWIVIGGAFSSVNKGTFRILKTFSPNTFYIQNVNAKEETVTLSANSDLVFYSYDSVLPGDSLVLEGGILGSTNNGTYTVSTVTSTVIVISQFFASNTSLVTLGNNFNQVFINEVTPYFAYRKLLNITPDPLNSNGYSMIIDNDLLSSKINSTYGSSVSATSKLNFSTSIQTGEDSYKYYGGLIHAVGRVVRGEAYDPIDYPGVAAAGSYIEIDSPIPFEIALSIVIKTATGTPFTTIQTRVQTAVSSYVNSLGIGQPVVFSEIISTIQNINGIQASAISSPTYNATSEYIPVSYNQKPLISNASSVLVSLSSS